MKISKNKILWFFNSSIIYLGLIFTAVFLSLIFLEPYANNLLIKSTTYASDSDIYEILIDDVSVEKKREWNGSDYADLLDYFYTYAKPKVIGFDINVALHEETESAKRFVSQISKMNNLVMSLVPVDKGSILSAQSQKKFSLDVDFKIPELSYSYSGIKGYSDKYIAKVPNYGSVMVNQKNDTNSLLDVPDIVKIGDSYFPSLPLKMYLVANGTNNVVIDDKNIIIPKTGLKIPYSDYNSHNGFIASLVRFNSLIYDQKSQSLLNVSHNNYSAINILNSYNSLKSGDSKKKKSADFVDPKLFENKIIFIGYNVSSEKADVIKTPVNARHLGVDIQSSVYDNFENSSFYQMTGISLAFFVFVLLSVLAFIFILKFGFLSGLICLICLDVLYLIVVSVMALNGFLMSYATPFVGQFVTAIFAYSFKFISENKNKEKIKQAMGKYLSQDIMKNVVNNIDDIKLGGKRAIVTVLFSDIRGFTSLSEKMHAEEVSMILNEYFSEMEPIITKYNGVINKFIGDAVMAIFGEPIKDDKHPQNAVKCAYEMLKKVEYLREKWLFEGKPRIEIGIGINTGEVFIGNIGTETRMEYTVIGDTVNLASRIESYNKVYKTNLLVSSSTYSYISSIADVIKISEVQIRGKAKKMDIYEVLRLSENKEKGRI